MESVVGVDDRGDLVVGRDLEERRLELIALGDVDGMNAVWEPDLLQHDRRLPTVRCRPGVKLDHGPSLVRSENDSCAKRE
jgi:hypothetical protein